MTADHSLEETEVCPKCGSRLSWRTNFVGDQYAKCKCGWAIRAGMKRLLASDQYGIAMGKIREMEKQIALDSLPTCARNPEKETIL